MSFGKLALLRWKGSKWTGEEEETQIYKMREEFLPSANCIVVLRAAYGPRCWCCKSRRNFRYGRHQGVSTLLPMVPTGQEGLNSNHLSCQLSLKPQTVFSEVRSSDHNLSNDPMETPRRAEKTISSLYTLII